MGSFLFSDAQPRPYGGRSHGGRAAAPRRSRGERWLGLSLVIGGHLAALAGVMSYVPAREAMAETMPIMVTLLSAAPRIEPPMPRPATPPMVPKPRVAPEPIREPVSQRAPEPTPTAPAPLAAAPVPATPPSLAAVAPTPRIESPAVAVVAPTITPPRFDAAYLDNPAPSYPSMSRRLREQGKVMLRVLVNPGGAPERVEVRSSSGSERLDHAAEDTVRRWRFVPARQGAEPVPAWVLVPISFNLEG